MVKLLLLLVAFVLGCNGSPPSSTPSEQPAPLEEKGVNEPSSGTIESLLALIEKLPEGTKSFELFVPQSLTWQGRPIDQNTAMTIVLDKLLGKGLVPDGFEQRPVGRRYKYKAD